MFRWIFLLLIIIPALEIGVLVWTGGLIGAWWVIVLIIFTGIVGAGLAKHQGLETLHRAQKSISMGIVPQEEIFDGVCILIGAILLLKPGFITDAIGFFLLIPTTRTPLKRWMQTILRKMMNSGRITIFRR